jgi:membrane fusion protein, multidrug efflux system
MTFKKTTLLLGLVVLIAAALVYAFVVRPKSVEKAGETEAVSGAGLPAAEETPLPVKALPVRRDDLVIRLKSPGEAFTERRVTVKAETTGKIRTLAVAEGHRARKGDVLIVLDDSELALRVERLDAVRLKYLSELLLESRFAPARRDDGSPPPESVRKAEDDMKKAAALFESGMMSQKEFDRIRRDYETALIESGIKKDDIQAAAKGLTQAEIDVKIARMDLEKTRIRAPFGGIVTDVRISPGEHVSAGQELFTLVDISSLKVRARVLESEVGKIRTGREAGLKFSAYPGRIFTGRVQAVSPIINPEDRTCAVHIAVDNPSELIKPGMHAEVEITSEIHPGKLLVPQAAVLVRGGRKLVFVVEEGTAKWRYIEAGLENEDFVEVREGVAEGEMVIVEGHFTLAHDARVRVVE